MQVSSTPRAAVSRGTQVGKPPRRYSAIRARTGTFGWGSHVATACLLPVAAGRDDWWAAQHAL